MGRLGFVRPCLDADWVYLAEDLIGAVGQHIEIREESCTESEKETNSGQRRRYHSYANE